VHLSNINISKSSLNYRLVWSHNNASLCEYIRSTSAELWEVYTADYSSASQSSRLIIAK